MAKAFQVGISLDRKTRINIVKRLFQLIKVNSLDEINHIFAILQPKQWIQILNSSIHGFIPLFVAIKFNNFEISRHLINISRHQGTYEMNKCWEKCRHPFLAAINVGNEKLIQLIITHLYNINNIQNNYSPLMIATVLQNLKFVKLILAMGADINYPCDNGRTPLMESTPNSEICMFLISQGANVNHQDDDGLTVLHVAIAKNNIEILPYLVDAGADVTIKTKDGLTPLIWATINLNVVAVNYLIQHSTSSFLDQIECYEILNACFLCAGHSRIDIWKQSTQFRRVYTIPKIRRFTLLDILDCTPEFKEAQLLAFEGKPFRLAYQGILVVERILGRKNRVYLKVLLQTALIAKNQNNVQRVRDLIDYIHNYSSGIDIRIFVANLRLFKTLFYEISQPGNPWKFVMYGGFVIYKMMGQLILNLYEKVEQNVFSNPNFVDISYSGFVDTFLHMSSITKSLIFSRHGNGGYIEAIKFGSGKVIKTLIQKDIRIDHYQSILQRAIMLMKTKTWSTVGLIESLIECGADVNAKDYFRWTPIMYALKHVPENNLNNVLALLLKCGAHSDCRNNEGFTAMDPIPWGYSLLAPKTPRSLQCLATEVILENEINYKGNLSNKAERVINFHV